MHITKVLLNLITENRETQELTTAAEDVGEEVLKHATEGDDGDKAEQG
jgi:hypothetical protein